MNALALALLIPSIAATTPDLMKIEQLGDSLYAYGSFDAAALEYKRLLFYSTYDSTRLNDSASGSPESLAKAFWGTRLALALYQNQEKNEADSILYSLDGPTARMVRAVLLIGEGNPYLAARQVDSATCAALGAPAYLLRGWCYFEAYDFTKAAKEFRNAGEDSLASVVEGLKDVKLKNPALARWLSLIPGLGETYAGRPLFGLWVFLVNAGDTYLVISNVIAKRYVDALLAYNFLWQRFYSGSMANADRFARDWNERTYKKTLDPIRLRFGEREALRLDLAALKNLRTP